MMSVDGTCSGNTPEVRPIFSLQEKSSAYLGEECQILTIRSEKTVLNRFRLFESREPSPKIPCPMTSHASLFHWLRFTPFSKSRSVQLLLDFLCIENKLWYLNLTNSI